MKPANVLTRFSDRVDDYIKYRPGYPSEVFVYLEIAADLVLNW